MITRYDPETEDIVFADPPPPSKYLPGGGGGSGGFTPPVSAPSTSKTKRDLESYSTSELRQLWRADRLTEDEWKAELVARGENAQSAADEIARQKNVGLSTAKATQGQPTASETSAVNAFRANAPTPIQRLDARVASGDYGQQGPTREGPPLEDITGGATGGGGAGPAGRTVDQVRGTQYLSDAERSWYLQQTGGAPTSSGGGTTAPRASTGTSTAAPRATSSGGGSSAGASAASGGGGGSTVAAVPGKLSQGSITRDELAELAASFSGALASVRYPDGSMDVYVRQPDGSYDYRRTDAAPAMPVRKVSPSEQAAASLVNTQQILGGRQPLGSSQAPTAPQATPQTVRNYADPAQTMGGGNPYYGEPREIRGPASALGQPGELVGMNIPYEGGSYQFNNGQAGQTLAAAGMIATGDPQKDMLTALGINAKRANMLAEPGATPLSVQDYFDSTNLGKDVYSRAKAVQATTTAADRALSGERLPAYGTDNLTAGQLSQYVTPRPEEPGVSYTFDPEKGYVQGFAEGTEEDRPIVAGAPPLAGAIPPSDSYRTTPNIPIEGETPGDPNRIAALNRMGTQNTSGPRYTAQGNIVRNYGQGNVYMPATGAGSWKTEERQMMPNWDDYIDAEWGGWEVGPGHVLQPQQQIMFQKRVDDWMAKYGISGGGLNFTRGGPPMAMQGTWRGNVRDYGFNGPSRGPRSLGMGGRYADGTSSPIMAGAPMGNTMYPQDTPMPGKPGFMTPEPLAMVGMQTGQTHGMVGEAGPEAISVTPMNPTPPTDFAMLMESLFSTKKSGRKAPLRPAGSSMMAEAGAYA